MNGFGFLGENRDGISSDFSDSIINFLDFPMENVEEEISRGDCNAGFQDLGPLASNALLGSSSNICSDIRNGTSEILTNHSVSCNETSQLQQPANFARGISSGSIPLQNKLSNIEELNVLQTSSPVSVLENSRPSSVEETRRFSPNSAHMRSENPCPSTLSQRLVTPTISSTSSASEKSHPSPTSESSSKVADSSESHLSSKIVDSVKRKLRKRKKKKLSLLSGSMEVKKRSLQKPVATRKCTHCEATKTPQWREGPMGPKTLCNACGVRYRSGRLFPEYRPAASPTFVASLHSNSHKKVIELRNKAKEEVTEAETDAALSPPPEFIPMSSYLFDCIFEEGGGNFSKLNAS